MLPRRLKNFNVFVEGYSLLGIAEEVELPKLARKFEEFRGAGLNGPVKNDFGHEAMELTLTSAELNPELIQTWGVADPAGVGLRFRAALEREGADAAVQAVEVVARGRFREIELGTAKPGEPHTAKYVMDLIYFKYSDNGTDLVEIDVLNFVEKVGGIDRLGEQRAALGI